MIFIGIISRSFNNEVKVSEHTYLQEIQTTILKKDFPKFLLIWEEYCTSDQVDIEEFSLILKAIKTSDFSKQMGKMIETALPVWQTIQDKEDAYQILKLIIDIQSVNSPELAELVLNTLKERYGNDPEFQERLRILGLRTLDNFQGALSNYDLLSHMQKGNFVFHSSGWGAGEIMDLSTLRQQVTIEFENVTGKKQITFDNAFKILSPIPSTHFLAERFANPDDLEEKAKNDPVLVVKKLLKDLGPKTASEIKDELCELVIPENDWVKWWQGARAKLKKDPFIESPEGLKEPFRLRSKEISHEELLHKAVNKKGSIDEVIEGAYSFFRDSKTAFKNEDVKKTLENKLLEQLQNKDVTKEQQLQICICLEDQFNHKVNGLDLKELITNNEKIEGVIHAIEIVALKKRALSLIREWRKDWNEIFQRLFLSVRHSALKEYILKELKEETLLKTLKELVDSPESNPESFLWYFNKVMDSQEKLPYATSEGKAQLFESLLILLNKIESKSEYKDLTKKIYVMISEDRYALVRKIMEGSSLETIKEYLLLAAKCHTFTDHDIKIFQSLATVVHPELGKGKKNEDDHNIVWTTEKGYLAVQEKIKHIGTIEVVENAREIEAARALGDLRENSEYKFAQEKRHRLQGQLKELSGLLNKARIITEEDISLDKVGVGNVVDVSNQKSTITYTILGPWDADPEANILSFQSKLAQSMLGKKKGETFVFKDETFKISDIRSYLKS